MPYLLDKTLLPVVKEVLLKNEHLSIDSLTEYIIDQYPQFSNRVPKRFEKSVMKVVLHLNEIDKKKQKRQANVAAQKNETQLNSDFFELDVTGEKPRNMHRNNLSEKRTKSEATPTSLAVNHSQVATVTPKARSIVPVAQSPITTLKRKTDELSSEQQVKRAQYKKLCLGMFSHSEDDWCSLSKLPGLEYVMKDVNSLLSVMRKSSRPVCLLVSGVAGAGKTVLVNAIAKELALPLHQINLNRILRTSSLTLEKKLQEEIYEGLDQAPSVVLISQTENLWADSSSSRQTDRDSVTELLHNILRHISRSVFSSEKILLVLECCHHDLVDLKLRNSFNFHIALKPPNADQRKDMLTKMCRNFSLSPTIDLTQVALKCSGFVANDLSLLVNRAQWNASERSDASGVVRGNAINSITQEDFKKAYSFALPSLKEGFPSIPDKTWESVGGLSDIREVLRMKIVDPIKDPDLMLKFNKTSSGVLLWGPPGCGKTLLAKAVANEAGVNLLIVNGPEVLSMYQGESERSVRMIFARAASVAPCVIFFDEFDSLCPQRSKNDSGSRSTIVNTLLTEMNGFLEHKGLYFMAATNLPTHIDTAVLRPGRFDTLVYVDLPDTEARVAVFKAVTKNGTHPALASEVDLELLAGCTEGFSGADCHSLVDTASTESWVELRNWREGNREGDSPFTEGEYKLYQRHFEAALKKVKPSVSEEDLIRYRSLKGKFQRNN